MNQNVKDRFLTYVSFDTQSDSSSSTVPSTEKQLKLAAYLADELKGLGLHDVEMDQYACVYAHIPASAGCARPGLALIAHMDTAMDMSGADIKPRIVTGYDGGDIVLNQEKNIVTRVSDYPSLAQFKGQDLIVTDGTTLLGADDKAGIPEIVTLAQYLMEHPEHPHPAISILFTPDEEIGRGADHVDVKKLDAAYGYTVDGGILGEFSYENFNAAGAVVTVHGVTAHTGYSKGVLKNAILMAMEYQCLLPVYETPACTEGREGFFHLDRMEGYGDSHHEIYHPGPRPWELHEAPGTDEGRRPIPEPQVRRGNRGNPDNGKLPEHVWEDKGPSGNDQSCIHCHGTGGRHPHCGPNPGRHGRLPLILHGTSLSQPVYRRAERPWTP